MKVIDVGCGPGTYVRALRDAGLLALGVDIDRNVQGVDLCRQMDATTDDFRAKYRDAFDVALCLEVAEHMPEAEGVELVRSLTTCAKLVIFSAAHPDQDGFGHVNCQPKQYWVERFARFGYVVDDSGTEEFLTFMGGGPHMGWLLHNAMIFRPYGDLAFRTIADEEGPQARRIAEYLADKVKES